MSKVQEIIILAFVQMIQKFLQVTKSIHPQVITPNKPPQDTLNVSVMTTLTTVTLQSIQLSSEPICLLKTAAVTVANKTTQVNADLLFDEGSQHSFSSQGLIDKLQSQLCQSETLQLSAFEFTNPQVKILNITALQVITNSGTLVLITVLIVPSIATPLENSVSTSTLTHLPISRVFSWPIQ